MPLVCKAFKAVSTPPTNLWRSIVVDMRMQGQKQKTIQAYTDAFFRARADHVENLAFLLHRDFYESSGFVPIILGSALGLQAPLKCLCVDFGGAVANHMRAVLSALHSCRRLEVLHLRNTQMSDSVSPSCLPQCSLLQCCLCNL